MTGGINDPHPNDESAGAVADPEDFFGPEDPGTEEAPEAATEPVVETTPVEPEGDVDAETAPEVEVASEPELEPAPAVEPEAPAPVQEQTPEPETPAEPDPAPETVAEAETPVAETVPGEEKKTTIREYIVLQEIVLDKEMLEAMLKDVKGGVEPVVALVEVHRAKASTALVALRDAWNAHKEQWTAPPRLASVTANKLQVRTMKVKVRETTGFEFE